MPNYNHLHPSILNQPNQRNQQFASVLADWIQHLKIHKEARCMIHTNLDALDVAQIQRKDFQMIRTR